MVPTVGFFSTRTVCSLCTESIVEAQDKLASTAAFVYLSLHAEVGLQPAQRLIWVGLPSRNMDGTTKKATWKQIRDGEQPIPY